MADLYAQGAPTLAKFAARQAPGRSGDARSSRPDRGAASDPTRSSRRARDRALDLSAFVQYPEQFLPLPFFSELPRDVFVPVIRALNVMRAARRATSIIREGEPGVAFYLVATGQVRVFATDGRANGTSVTPPARGGAVRRDGAADGAAAHGVGPGGRRGRPARARARARWPRVEAEVPSLGAALAKFARERLLKNLLATSPLFKPFNHQQQMDLIRRFDGPRGRARNRDHPRGRRRPGPVTSSWSGEVEVSKRPGAGGEREVPLARLRAGDVFGEMSLLRDQPTTASVRAVRQTTILFLAREYFQRLVEAVPEIRTYFEELSAERDLDTRRALGNEGGRHTDPDVRVMI